VSAPPEQGIGVSFAQGQSPRLSPELSQLFSFLVAHSSGLILPHEGAIAPLPPNGQRALGHLRELLITQALGCQAFLPVLGWQVLQGRRHPGFDGLNDQFLDRLFVTWALSFSLSYIS
jgi:hypothetical protein